MQSEAAQHRNFRADLFCTADQFREILTDEEPMPFLLDETFARYDETRIRNTLQWIGTQGRQMILFTCHKREMEYLDAMGIAYHKIELEGQ